MYTVIDKSLSLFGTFELNEAKSRAIAENFKDLRLQVGKDRNGNFAARLADPEGKVPYAINIGYNRVDYFLGKFGTDARQDLLKMIDALTIVLDVIKDYGVNRLAFNARAFIKDEDGAKRKQLGDRVDLIKTEAPMVETQIRLNYLETFMDEKINNVVSVQDANVNDKTQDTGAIKALVVATDINTLAANTQARFGKDTFEAMFTKMMEFSTRSFDQLDELLK